MSVLFSYLLAITPRCQSITCLTIKLVLITLLAVRIGFILYRNHKINEIDERMDRISGFIDVTK